MKNKTYEIPISVLRNGDFLLKRLERGISCIFVNISRGLVTISCTFVNISRGLVTVSCNFVKLSSRHQISCKHPSPQSTPNEQSTNLALGLCSTFYFFFDFTGSFASNSISCNSLGFSKSML